MKMTGKIIFVCVLVFITASTLPVDCLALQPGHGEGNGGDVRVINNLVELLSLAEKEGFEPKDSDYFKNEVLPRLIKIESAYYEYHRKYHDGEEGYRYLHNFLDDSLKKMTWFFADSLPEIDDEGVDFYEIEIEGELRQIAAQFRNVVIIKHDLFDAMKPRHRAGLVIHELILNHVLNTNPEVLGRVEYEKATGTSKIRTFESYILMEDFQNISSQKLISAFRRIGVRDIEGPYNYKNYDYAASDIAMAEVKEEYKKVSLSTTEFIKNALLPLTSHQPRGDIQKIRRDFSHGLSALLRDNDIMNKIRSEFLDFLRGLNPRDLTPGELGKYQHYYTLWVEKLATEYNYKGVFGRILSGGGINRSEAKKLAALETAVATYNNLAKELEAELKKAESERNEKKVFPAVYLNLSVSDERINRLTELRDRLRPGRSHKKSNEPAPSTKGEKSAFESDDRFSGP